MATRPVFVPHIDTCTVDTIQVDFRWYPGYSSTQKQLSIADLHRQANKLGILNILEVSSKSDKDIGIHLSAFNLRTKTLRQNKEFSVESAFQASKVFTEGGPYIDLLFEDSRTAKKDPRIKNSGQLVKFSFFGEDFPLEPKTMFYDWLYISTLLKNKSLIPELTGFCAFTDIEFNPQKSINCQAFSLALFRVLYASGNLDAESITPSRFAKITKNIYRQNRLNSACIPSTPRRVPQRNALLSY